MSENSFETIKTLLVSEKPEELRQGLELVRQEISRVGSSEAKPLFEMVSAMFYIDPLDRPDLVPVLDEAISLVVGFGEWVIPMLLENLDAGDIKAQLAIGHALGRIGADAIKPLMTAYQASADLVRRMFILYAMGKIKSPRIVQAAHLAIEAAQSTDLELRDTATRAIGKFVESIPPSDLPEELRVAFMERLQHNLADPSPGIRAKAVRSFGKLAKYGHLNATERKKLKALCQLILGEDENFEWDRAYVVRKEAKEALRYT
jgi:HEAT repeat protein